MSDQIKASDNVGTPIAGEAPAYTETERSAMDQGWMPLDKWTEAGRDPSDHRSAREFKDRGELLKRIQDQTKYIQQLSGSFETLRQHNVKSYEAAYKKAVTDLRAQHAAAVNDGDIAKADKVLNDLEAERAHFQGAVLAQAQAQTPVVNDTSVDEWKKSNKWYDTDEDLRATADAFGFKFVQQRGGKTTPEEVLRHVSQKMERFLQKDHPLEDGEPAPAKFTAPNPVGSRTTTRAAAVSIAGLSERDLDDDEAKAMKDFVKYGLGTKADYLKQLKQIRG